MLRIRQFRIIDSFLATGIFPAYFITGKEIQASYHYDILLQAAFPFCWLRKFFIRKFSAETRSGSFSITAETIDLVISNNGRSCTMLANLKFSIPLCLVPSISPGPRNSISFSAISKPLLVAVKYLDSFAGIISQFRT